MNFSILAKLIGQLLVTFGAAMAPALFCALVYKDGSARSLLLAMAATLATGGGLYLWGRRRKQEIFRKEATATVGLGWILCAAAGALPYYFYQLGHEEFVMNGFTDCFFESMSGLTTTGASILTDIESLPKGLLFWRSFTHWLGGLGIIMLFVAILPYLGAGGRALVRSEVTGPVKEGLTPRIIDTAQLLYRLYIGYTVAETLLLKFVGKMSWFDSLCHTFGTLATGGFSTRNASIAAYDNISVELIVILFMLLAGMNFALLHAFFLGKSLKLWRDTEWRTFVLLVVASTLFVTVVLFRSSLYEGAGRALRDSAFTVVALFTGTGFVTADFEQWPVAIKCLLIWLMFVGGCAGSTAGGMKVVRWIVLFKIARSSLEGIYHPRTVRRLKLGGAVLGDDLQRAILSFSLLWVLVLVAGSLLIATLEGDRMDLVTPFSAVISTLNNIGPGLAQIGPTDNYAFFTPVSKWLLSLFMVLGRLELYSILVLFVPRFWRVD